MKRLIMFDFYGVLGGEISPKWFKKHFPNDDYIALKNKYFIPADNGEYTITETLKMISKDFNMEYSDVLNGFMEYVKTNDELFEYIKKLRKNNTLALLSNAAIGIFDLFFPEINFSDYFDKAFISGEHRMQKPDLRFYSLCKNSFNTEFDEVYMIDDNPTNLKDLDKIGIKAIRYTDNKSLFEILDKFI
ncbi:MAG: HAD-IA family hydrolase [Gammaproteobacteria bacterium]|nr:HAD-IA family hydrolase [Gammaproteobacteria bacterium]